MSLGAPEVLVVLIVALIVLGPTRLPEAARQAGKALAEFRRTTDGLKADLRDAFIDPEEDNATGAPKTLAQHPHEAEVDLTAEPTKHEADQA